MKRSRDISISLPTLKATKLTGRETEDLTAINDNGISFGVALLTNAEKKNLSNAMNHSNDLLMKLRNISNNQKISDDAYASLFEGFKNKIHSLLINEEGYNTNTKKKLAEFVNFLKKPASDIGFTDNQKELFESIEQLIKSYIIYNTNHKKVDIDIRNLININEVAIKLNQICRAIENEALGIMPLSFTSSSSQRRDDDDIMETETDAGGR